MRARPVVPLLCLVLAAALLAVGLVYFLTECRDIPAPLPGRTAGSSDHRDGFGVVAIVLAVLALAAGLAERRRTARPL